jgi:ABC-2 type transport system permease protein
VNGIISQNLHILRFSFRSAIADFRAMYTWRTWLFGWLARALCQVAFFSLIGRMVGSPRTAAYLVIGNSVLVVAQAVLLTISSTAWERMTGTLPLLVAAPGSLFVVFLGRSVQWVGDGIACGAVSLLLVGPLFGIGLSLGGTLAAIPILLVVALAVYTFSLALGGVVLRAMDLRALAANLSIFALMLLCGVQVPTSFWPRPVALIAEVLPVTHGLRAIRALLANSPAATVVRDVTLEAAVGLGWLCAAALIFYRLVEGGRADGSIEFG